MDVHKNARSCPRSRELLADRVLACGWTLREAAEAGGISVRRAREWIDRARNGASLEDRTSRPQVSHEISLSVRSRVIELRRDWWTMRQIAQYLEISLASVSRICRKANVSRLRALDPPPKPVRYECDHPGDLLHIDVKRLGRFSQVGHRITRTRSYGKPKMGFEFVFVATDDASRTTFASIYPDEKTSSSMSFLLSAVDWFAARGVNIDRIMTDNGSAFVSRGFTGLCSDLGIRHTRTRPYTPRTNGKVERMIQTLLREWAYRFSYDNSEQRHQWLDPYLHFYNHHRAHSALDYHPPVSRLIRNNLLKRNS